jgi:hypothetical protein
VEEEWRRMGGREFIRAGEQAIRRRVDEQWDWGVTAAALQQTAVSNVWEGKERWAVRAGSVCCAIMCISKIDRQQTAAWKRKGGVLRSVAVICCTTKAAVWRALSRYDFGACPGVL